MFCRELLPFHLQSWSSEDIPFCHFEETLLNNVNFWIVNNENVLLSILILIILIIILKYLWIYNFVDQAIGSESSKSYPRFREVKRKYYLNHYEPLDRSKNITISIFNITVLTISISFWLVCKDHVRGLLLSENSFLHISADFKNFKVRLIRG